MATLNDTDLFLVNRSNNTYKVEQQNLMASLQDTDLLLVNRNGTSYKITGSDFKNSIQSPPAIQNVNLVEDDSTGDRYTNQGFTSTISMLDDGNPISTKSIRAKVTGEILNIPATSASVTVSGQGFDSSGISRGTIATNETDFLRIYNTDTTDFWGEDGTMGGQNPSKNMEWRLTTPLQVLPGEVLEMAGYAGGGFKPGIQFDDGSNYGGTQGLLNDNYGDPPLIITTQTSWRDHFAHQFGLSGQYTNISYIKLNGFVFYGSNATITFPQGEDLSDFNVGDVVKQDVTGATGYIRQKTTGTTPTLWIQNIYLQFSNGYKLFGPSTTSSISTKFLDLNASLNVAGLTDDSSFTQIQTNPQLEPTITFPALLNSGQAPDAQLPAGTSIQTEILAENAAGSANLLSNVVTPQLECVSGNLQTSQIASVSNPINDTFIQTFNPDGSGGNLVGGDPNNLWNTTSQYWPDTGAGSGADGKYAIVTFNPPLPVDETNARIYVNYCHYNDSGRDWRAYLSINDGPEIDGSTVTNTEKNGEYFDISNMGIKSIAKMRYEMKAVVSGGWSPNVRAFSTIWSGGESYRNLTQYELEFTSPNLDLEKFENGDPVTQGVNGDTAQGAVISIDTDLNKMVVQHLGGIWGPGFTNKVVDGPYYQCPPVVFRSNITSEVDAYNAIKDAFDEYENDKATYLADVRQRLVTAGFSNAEITNFGL